MHILAVDIGTGTQDILLHNTRLSVENGYKLVVPSPTMIINRKVKQETSRRNSILLEGCIMGGGPSNWAVRGHLEQGLPVFATPDAAKSFNDDLEVIRQSGITLVSEDEAASLPDSIVRIKLTDFDFDSINQAFMQFGVSLNQLEAIALAVFDHGNAPAGYSDRQFRFDYINNQITENDRLSTFAFTSSEIPAAMTRMQAAADAAGSLGIPIVVMDTAPAAVQGALLDEKLRGQRQNIIVNIGNYHTLAFKINNETIEGVFEHHTGLVNPKVLDRLISKLADGSLTHAEVFSDTGHGAWVKQKKQTLLTDPDIHLTITGPRRSMMKTSHLQPYFAAPYGDMMLTGCFGLLKAVADSIPDIHDEIIDSLTGPSPQNNAPWEAI